MSVLNRKSKLESIFGSIKGIDRAQNKDNCLVIENDNCHFYAIFDGVSSAKDSQKATILASDFIKGNYEKYIAAGVDLPSLMYDVNQFILASDLIQPYTTYCVVLFFPDSDSVYYSSMGDSRIYLMTNQYFERITTDDSVLGNIVTKFLGNPNMERSDFFQVSLKKEGKNILLCTDGFYSLMEKDKIIFFDFFRKKSLAKIKANILSLIDDKNSDDATFVFIR